MSTWSEERRLNNAADAEQRRKDQQLRADLAAKERREAAEFAREQRQADREEERREKARRRADRQKRRADRARNWTPETLYGRSTYTIVIASALASLPAQFLHFGHISLLLLTIPIALEGAAWCTFAGVAYADEKGLHPAIRWALRALSMVFASFAAWINWLYGMSLAPKIGDGEAIVVAAALAAVTMLGPLLFEVRQWVRTLSATSRDPKQRAADKARRKHEKERAKTFKKVTARQQEILLAAPYGTVTEERAWSQAWADVEGAQPGVTAAVVAHRLAAERAIGEAVAKAEKTPEALAVDAFLAELFPASRGDDGPTGGTRKKGPQGGPRGDGGRGAHATAKETPEGATALGRKGKQPSGRTTQKTPQKPLDPAHIDKVRRLAEISGGADKLSARKVREVIGGGSNEYAVRLRDAVQADANK
jgi:hypothetical protein